MNLELNQKVYVWRTIGWSGREYIPGTVVKITPSGLVDVLIGSSAEPTRFDKRGKERGTSWRMGWYLDDEMPFYERSAWAHKENIRIRAVDEFNKLVGGLPRLDRSTSTESLKATIQDLTTKLAEIEY